MIEVFKELDGRMLKGIMLHAQLTDYFDFLNLHGFKRWQEYRFFDETAELRGLHRYAINHCNKLIGESTIENPRMIPQDWGNYTRLQVDSATRKAAVKEAFSKWYEWEKSTKEFYESKFKTLTDNNKIADADKVNCLVCAVDQELKVLTRKMLEYKAVDYDMSYIMYQQPELHEYYKQKTKDIGIDIC